MTEHAHMGVAATTLPQEGTKDHNPPEGSGSASRDAREALGGHGLPVLADCRPLQARLTEAACVRMHAAAGRSTDPTACRRCEVGAQRAGLPSPTSAETWRYSDLKPGTRFDGVEVLSEPPPFRWKGSTYI